MFHDGRDEDIGTVADGINLSLLALDVLVHQHRGILIDFHRVMQIMLQSVVVTHNHHRTAAKNEARTHQDRVTDVMCGLQAFLNACNSVSLRLADSGAAHDSLEELAVLGVVDSLKARAYQRNIELLQRSGQVDGRLSAKSDDNALRLLQADHIHYVLRRERFKIQFVGDCVVRGYRLRVVVDDYCLIAGLPDGPDCMDGGIIELHTLSDADRPAAQYQDLLADAGQGLVLLLVGGVEVRDIGLALSGAGIYHLVYRDDVVCKAEPDDIGL